jgi:hypothetical protein
MITSSPLERHRVASIWVFIEFRTLGGGPRDHETLHHIAVLELVFHGVCMVWVGLPLIPVVMVGHGRGPLKALHVPLLASLDALLSAVDGEVRRCLLAAARGCLLASLGRMKFNRLIVGGVLGGDVAWLLGGVPENVVVFALAWVLCMMLR